MVNLMCFFFLTTIEKQSKNTLQFSKSGGTIMSSSLKELGKHSVLFSHVTWKG